MWSFYWLIIVVILHYWFIVSPDPVLLVDIDVIVFVFVVSHLYSINIQANKKQQKAEDKSRRRQWTAILGAGMRPIYFVCCTSSADQRNSSHPQSFERRMNVKMRAKQTRRNDWKQGEWVSSSPLIGIVVTTWTTDVEVLMLKQFRVTAYLLQSVSKP